MVGFWGTWADGKCLPADSLSPALADLMMDSFRPFDCRKNWKRGSVWFVGKILIERNFLDQTPFSGYEVGTFFLLFASDKVVPPQPILAEEERGVLHFRGVL